MIPIKEAFDHGKAFVAFLTCGDPDLETTAQLVPAIAEAGADLIELGIPFSDPTAEGPVIQNANIRALSAGVTTDKIFDMVRKIRGEVRVPLAFMTYANVVFSYGTERFLRNAAECGVSGLILPDVPYEEREEFAAACDRYGVALIALVAPTSAERIAKIAESSAGFVYCVSSLGVTGVRGSVGSDSKEMVSLVRRTSALPCAVGFGISTPQQAAEIAAYADGVIVGSAIVKLMEQYGRSAKPYVTQYVRSMKNAMTKQDQGGNNHV